MVEVSVIVVTYNALWEKLKMTINSILMQDDIEYELIFADDGSKIKWNEKIVEYVPTSCNCIFVDSENNIGTVSNIFNGIKKARGKYVKVISPGDCLNGRDALKKWVHYMKQSNVDLSFCNAIYYEDDGCVLNVISKPSAPRNVNIYHEKHNRKKIFIAYLLANDSILGAAVMGKREILKAYLEEMQGKIKYAEDYMIRLLVYDGRMIGHVDEKLIWYEYGEGISTTKNNKWADLLKKDFDATNNIIKNRKNNTEQLRKKYQRYLQGNNSVIVRKLIKVCMFPAMVWYRLEMKKRYYKTPMENISLLQDIIDGTHIVEKIK